MELIVNTVIGGQVITDTNINLRMINIKLIKELKELFKVFDFKVLNKIKLNLYINGDISEYSNSTGISKKKYFPAKQELTSEINIVRDFWHNIYEVEKIEYKLKKLYKDCLIELASFVQRKNNIEFFDYQFITNTIKDW